MDPLSLLREWTIAKRVPRVEKGMVYFGDISYRLDEPTAFRATRVSGEFCVCNPLVKSLL